MGKRKRVLCGFLAAVLVISYPIRPKASVVAAVAVSEYIFMEILAACGIVVSTATVAALLGSFTSEETYRAQGAARELGPYAQRVYDHANGDIIDFNKKKKFKKIEEKMLVYVKSNWGDEVEVPEEMIEDMKEFLLSVCGRDVIGKHWTAPSVPKEKVWGYSSWSSLDFYPLPTTPTFSVPSVAYDTDYILFLTSFVPYGEPRRDVMNVQNRYYHKSMNLFGLYNAKTEILTTYKYNSEQKEYAKYSNVAYSAYILENGDFAYTIGKHNSWESPDAYCSPCCAGSLPFPVFIELEDALHFVNTGEKRNLYESGTIPFEADSFREDVAELPISSYSSTFTLPSDEEKAVESLNNLAQVYPEGDLNQVSNAITNGGIQVRPDTVIDPDIPVDPDNPTEPDKPVNPDTPENPDAALLPEILENIQGLPDAFGDKFEDWMSSEDLEGEEESEEDYKVSSIIADKFPFCVPFDLIHCVKALEASKVEPVWRIPFRLRNERFHYEQEIVIDLSGKDWEKPVVVIRYMVLLGYIVFLITITRNIVKG